MTGASHRCFDTDRLSVANDELRRISAALDRAGAPILDGDGDHLDQVERVDALAHRLEDAERVVRALIDHGARGGQAIAWPSIAGPLDVWRSRHETQETRP